MTSKNFSAKTAFNILTYNLKQNLWIPTLSFICFFFAIVVNGMGQIQYLTNRVIDENSLIYNTSQLSGSVLGLNNIATAFILMAAAVIVGLSTQAYLHKSSKIDFYHSQPVRRETLFWANLKTAGIGVLVPFYLNVLIGIAVISISGYGNAIDLSVIAPSVLVQSIYFCSVLVMTILAGQLTGNFFIHVLLTPFLLFIVTLAIGIYQMIMSISFSTFVTTTSFYTAFINSSPVLSYFYSGGGFSPFDYYLTGQSLFDTKAIIIVVIYTLILAAIALLLNKKRPSEVAGNTIAFKWIRYVIGCPLTIFGSVGIGIILRQLFYSNQNEWLIFGTVIGVLLITRIVEIICESDFKAIKKGLPLAGVYLAISLAMVLIPTNDVIDYDGYIPEKDDIAAVSIYSTSGTIENVSGFEYVYFNEANMGYYYYEINHNSYAYTSDEAIDLVLALANAGINASTTDLSDVNEVIANEDYRYTITYTLDNGRTVSRYYAYVPAINVAENYVDLLATNEFQTLLQEYATNALADSSLIEIEIFEGFDSVQTFPVASTINLINAILQDKNNFEASDYLTEVPVAQILFRISEDYYYYIEEAIYPSYTNTLELLASYGMDLSEAGINAMQEDSLDNIDYLLVYEAEYLDNYADTEIVEDYATYSYDSIVADGDKITDEAQILEILQATKSNSALALNPFIYLDRLQDNYTVVYKDGTSDNRYYVETIN